MMTDRELQLNESRSGAVPASGVVRLTIGPNRPGTRWQVRTVALSATVADPMPQAKVYLGSTASAGAYLGGTYDGAADSTDLDVTLHAGQQLLVEWTGATPGDTCTVSVLGTLVTV